MRNEFERDSNPLVRPVAQRTTASGECELTRQPCEVCGAPYALAHHEDYREPLAVVWLCRRHHVKRHLDLDPWIEVRRQQSLGRTWHPQQPRLADIPLTHNGETLAIADWAVRHRMHPSTLYLRVIRRGWPVALALSLRPASRGLNGRISRLVRAARHCLADLQKEQPRRMQK